MTQTSGAGGGGMQTSGAGGEVNVISSSVTLEARNVISVDTGGVGASNHNHGLTHIVVGVNFNTQEVTTSPLVPSGAHEHPPHGHLISVEPHMHEIVIPNRTHMISIPNHVHNIEHTHNMSHTHQIPSHIHAIEYGIHEGANSNRFVVEVDGIEVKELTTAKDDFDIVPYLKKDEDGKVIRGWHDIRIKPLGQAKITAMVMVQTFINSKGDITV